MKLDDIFLQRMKGLLGNEYDNYIKSFESEEERGLRVNTLKISVEKLSFLLPFEKENIKWCDEGLYYPSEFRPGKSPLYNAGLFYIQEPSAMITGSVININESDKVLDLCSAPGGKTTQIGARLNGTGFVVSNDISPSRLKGLIKNVELFGIDNLAVISSEPENLSPKFDNYFDKIIVDAPCSGEGMFRKHEKTLKAWTQNSSDFFSKMQKQLLNTSAKLVKSGGEIVYSTCTFSEVENEFIIKDFLDSHLDFEIINLDHKKLSIEKAFGDVVKDDRIFGCGRILPYKQKGDGHFIAHLKCNKEKKESGVIPYKSEKINELNLFNDFCEKNLNIKFQGEFKQIESGLFLLKNNMPDFKGFRVLKSGLYLGEFKKGRFEPSQALAMNLKKENSKRVIDFGLDDERIIRYLKGESFEVEGEDGYTLVCVCGYPLGFGKILDNRLKNKYLKSWRIE